ncbi:hypothetical protein [Kineosporia sp. NBRC 101731]|uniref:hypothetical protein n=1 Tax=Kineosporia sp. NBRC 101731 TaxID=3032199 RepID=UPI0025548487|nr:hypothetical protein [Kineosporia sp. NBRC 101731]
MLAEPGRDAEAQAVMQRLRGDLVEEYGADLSSVVTEVHLVLLRGDLPVLCPGVWVVDPAGRTAALEDRRWFWCQYFGIVARYAS